MSYPETAYISLGLTRLCGKRVGRAPGRSERPTEPGDSWLTEKWIEVQPRTPQTKKYYYQDIKGDVRELVERGTALLTKDTTFTGG